MAEKSETTRWWENYLPRYLMPSIAGVILVNWLSYSAGDDFRTYLLLLPASGKALDSTTLILLLLYGNLFCYIASYPVLAFHATRVIDFENSEWVPRLDGYILTVLLLTCVFLFRLLSSFHRYWWAYGAAALLSAIQLGRLRAATSRKFDVRNHTAPFTHAYYFSYILADRRVSDEKEGTEGKDTRWREEFIETYRHLREHGNSGFIFVLEIVLAGLTFCVISKPAQTPSHILGMIGVLFAIWALPSIFVHLLAQYLERRFSRYDFKLSENMVLLDPAPKVPPPK